MSHSSEDDQQWEARIREVEETLLNLRRRYSQIQRDRAKKEKLETTIQQLQSELESLESELESRLVSWKDLAEPFWLAVRFGGLGIVIGWLLRAWADSN